MLLYSRYTPTGYKFWKILENGDNYNKRGRNSGASQFYISNFNSSKLRND